MSVPQKICEIRCGAKGWDESQWGFFLYGFENGLLLRIIYHTERLKPFSDCGRTVFFLRVSSSSNQISSHLVLLMLGDRRFFRQFGGRRNFRWDWAFVVSFFMLVFMSKIRVKARLTSLHCSQGYRFSVEPNVNSLYYCARSSWVCFLTSIVL